MGRQVEFEIAGTSFVAELLDEKAPRVCDALWKALPLESETHHAKVAGEEIFFSFPEAPTEEPENEVYIYDLKPGEISLMANTMVVCYGSMEHEPYLSSLVMQVTQATLEPFKEACRRSFRTPGEKVILRKRV